MSNIKKKVVLGMSGGVDSSLSVHLLQEAGYEVIGVHMVMIPEHLAIRSTAVDDARKVAEKLKIEFHVLDVRQQFEEQVIEYFVNDYIHGRTPNPCMICNQQVKFKFLAQYAQDTGADYIATGHYVQVAQDKETGQYYLKKATDLKKDQSYFLAQIEPQLLSKVIFPLGQYTKDAVRQLAEQIGLAVANKPDSQEICFIKGDDYKAFLRQVAQKRLPKGGQFLDSHGQILGKHQGIHQYTIGQRKGLGIALGKPAYVIGIDDEKNQVIIGDNEQLMGFGLIASQNNFFIDLPFNSPVTVEAKVRYRALPAEAIIIRKDSGDVQVTFKEPQRAITPGQGVCYYMGDRVIGGGIIEKVNLKE